jgi:putative queuosine salvage protein
MSLPDDVRAACARVAARARLVRIDHEALDRYELPLPAEPPALDPETHWLGGSREDTAGFVLSIDAINFGSGWWPTIRKRPGRSGYFTMALSLKEHFEREGPWTADELRRLDTEEVARIFGQDPGHELMPLFARALRELGERVGGRFAAFVDSAGGSAVALAEELATWPTWDDVSPYGSGGDRVPFFKRAQLVGADLHHAGVAELGDLDRLTLFADNLVPHVLRMDGVLVYDPGLAAHIDREEPIEHHSEGEVEIRACALHAVELLAAARATTPQELDYLLWNRGQLPRYKAHPRHRARTTAY